MGDSYLFNYDRYGKTSSTTPFAPNNSNWLISANGNNESYYFQNVTSYNNWAGTCCGASYDAIKSGSFGGYKVNYNKF